MRALLQRVTHASVRVDDEIIGKIDQGLLVFIGIAKTDDIKKGERLIERLLNYRIFADADDKMNCSVQDIKGGVLLVPQFTLAADTRKGNRPGFSDAMDPSLSEDLFNELIDIAKQRYSNIAIGQFSANMQVSLCNDGPVTFVLDV